MERARGLSIPESSATKYPFEVRPLTGHVGAELFGVDLTVELDEQVVRGLKDAFLDHHVVFVPHQHLRPDQLLSLASRFGEIYPNPLSPKAEGFPDVTELVTNGHTTRGPEIWHFDTSYATAPPKASLLSMVRTPPVGGDTMWVSMHAVYESLSASMREFLDGLTVAYDSAALGGRPGHVAEHPLVRRHPETGRQSLYFDPMYATRVLELRRHESDALLAFLRSSVQDPAMACRYRWTNGAFAMWDNRCTLHRVANDFVGERVIQRVTVA